MKKIALVTGASAGLGVEFATQLDQSREVDEIWLVARRQSRLEEVAAQLKHATGVVIPLDLTDTTAPDLLAERLEAAGDVRLAWLINNAGYGSFGKFAKTDLDFQLGMIDLNCRALTAVTHRCLPFMGQGDKIVNVGSSAGFMAMPSFAVYAATKSYVFAFSQALAAESKKLGIGVTVVCPGPVETEFQQVANLDDRIDGVQAKFTAQPDDVVRKALADARKGQPTSIYGLAMQAYSRVVGFLPRDLVAKAGNIFAERM